MVTAKSRSKATAPNPTQRGLYPAENGTTASIHRKATNPSITADAMWTARKIKTTSDTLRCNHSMTNRGHRDDEHRTEVRTPRTTAAVSRSSATAPVPRVRYQSVFVSTAALTVESFAPQRASRRRTAPNRHGERAAPAGHGAP